VKIAGYVRVSTEAQAERGQGLQVQERALRAWAKANGHQVTTVYRDEGVSGTKGLDERVGLAAALGALRSRAVQGLVVYRLDRLARDLVLQEQLLREVHRMGGELFSTSAAENGNLKDDPDDPSRRLIRQVLGAVAEFERGTIVMRLRQGRALKAASGGYAYGAPPLGQRAVDGALVTDPVEAVTVARIVTLRAEGRSLRQIADTLDSEGLRTKRGGRWHPPTVARVLERVA
jgi:DNA invertase Pin-like site-specific DNA recombinase